MDWKTRQINVAFRSVLRQQRRDAQLTQAELAVRARVSRENISRLEQGKRVPTIAMVFRLCGGLGVSPELFVSQMLRSME